MAEKVLMLALSPTMEEGTIANWKKSVGDAVTQGEVLCEVETDKATMDYESVQEGTLLKILVDSGEDAAVGLPIAIIGDEGEDVSSLAEEASKELKAGGGAEAATDADKSEDKKEPQESPPPEKSEKKAEQSQAEAPKPESPKSETSRPKQSASAEDGWIKASPLARELARQRGIRLESLSGSGPEGRIVKRDIDEAAASPARAYERQPAETGMAAFAATAPAAGEDRTIKISKMRKSIAARLAESKYSAPHFYLNVSVRGEALLGARGSINKKLPEKVSVNAFLIKLAAEALKRHPRVNASWEEDSIREFGSIDVGLAVALDDGLITPVVRNCGNKGIIAIDQELKELIPRAQNGKLAPEEYSGATFSISNLGSFGIEDFTAIINPPGSAILAVGAMQKVPVVNDAGNLEVGQQMKLTLSCDHRVVDGAIGARFLDTLKGNLENPMFALL